MAKSSKKIQVEVKETAKNKEGFVELALYVNQEQIGMIQQEEGKPVTVLTKAGIESKAKSIDEGINNLLMDYNLHQM